MITIIITIMRPDNYVQQFENESRGTKIINNRPMMIKFIISITVFILFSVVLTMDKNKTNTINDKNDNNIRLNSYLKSIYQNIPTTLPTSIPNSKKDFFESLYSQDFNETITEPPTPLFSIINSLMNSLQPTPVIILNNKDKDKDKHENN